MLIRGSNYTRDETDPRTPLVHSSLKDFVKTMVLGVSLPWNLVVTAILGGWLLFADSFLGFSGLVAKSGNVMGALTVVCSIIAWAEVARALRFLNLLLMAWLIVGSIILPGATTTTVIHGAILGGVVIVLSLFKGSKIKEKYGTWQKLIF